MYYPNYFGANVAPQPIMINQQTGSSMFMYPTKIQPYNDKQFLCRTFSFRLHYIQAFLSLTHDEKLKFFMLIQQRRLTGQITDLQIYRQLLNKIMLIANPQYGKQQQQQCKTVTDDEIKNKNLQNQVDQICEFEMRKLGVKLNNNGNRTQQDEFTFQQTNNMQNYFGYSGSSSKGIQDAEFMYVSQGQQQQSQLGKASQNNKADYVHQQSRSDDCGLQLLTPAFSVEAFDYPFSSHNNQQQQWQQAYEGGQVPSVPLDTGPIQEKLESIWDLVINQQEIRRSQPNIREIFGKGKEDIKEDQDQFEQYGEAQYRNGGDQDINSQIYCSNDNQQFHSSQISPQKSHQQQKNSMWILSSNISNMNQNTSAANQYPQYQSPTPHMKTQPQFQTRSNDQLPNICGLTDNTLSLDLIGIDFTDKLNEMNVYADNKSRSQQIVNINITAQNRKILFYSNNNNMDEFVFDFRAQVPANNNSTLEFQNNQLQGINQFPIYSNKVDNFQPSQFRQNNTLQIDLYQQNNKSQQTPNYNQMIYPNNFQLKIIQDKDYQQQFSTTTVNQCFQSHLSHNTKKQQNIPLVLQNKYESKGNINDRDIMNTGQDQEWQQAEEVNQKDENEERTIEEEKDNAIHTNEVEEFTNTQNTIAHDPLRHQAQAKIIKLNKQNKQFNEEDPFEMIQSHQSSKFNRTINHDNIKTNQIGLFNSDKITSRSKPSQIDNFDSLYFKLIYSYSHQPIIGSTESNNYDSTNVDTDVLCNINKLSFSTPICRAQISNRSDNDGQNCFQVQLPHTLKGQATSQNDDILACELANSFTGSSQPHQNHHSSNNSHSQEISQTVNKEKQQIPLKIRKIAKPPTSNYFRASEDRIDCGKQGQGNQTTWNQQQTLSLEPATIQQENPRLGLQREQQFQINSSFLPQQYSFSKKQKPKSSLNIVSYLNMAISANTNMVVQDNIRNTNQLAVQNNNSVELKSQQLQTKQNKVLKPRQIKSTYNKLFTYIPRSSGGNKFLSKSNRSHNFSKTLVKTENQLQISSSSSNAHKNSRDIQQHSMIEIGGGQRMWESTYGMNDTNVDVYIPNQQQRFNRDAHESKSPNEKMAVQTNHQTLNYQDKPRYSDRQDQLQEEWQGQTSLECRTKYQANQEQQKVQGNLDSLMTGSNGSQMQSRNFHKKPLTFAAGQDAFVQQIPQQQKCQNQLGHLNNSTSASPPISAALMQLISSKLVFHIPESQLYSLFEQTRMNKFHFQKSYYMKFKHILQLISFSQPLLNYNKKHRINKSNASTSIFQEQQGFINQLLTKLDRIDQVNKKFTIAMEEEQEDQLVECVIKSKQLTFEVSQDAQVVKDMADKLREARQETQIQQLSGRETQQRQFKQQGQKYKGVYYLMAKLIIMPPTSSSQPISPSYLNQLLSLYHPSSSSINTQQQFLCLLTLIYLMHVQFNQLQYIKNISLAIFTFMSKQHQKLLAKINKIKYLSVKYNEIPQNIFSKLMGSKKMVHFLQSLGEMSYVVQRLMQLSKRLGISYENSPTQNKLQKASETDKAQLSYDNISKVITQSRQLAVKYNLLSTGNNQLIAQSNNYNEYLSVILNGVVEGKTQTQIYLDIKKVLSLNPICKVCFIPKELNKNLQKDGDFITDNVVSSHCVSENYQQSTQWCHFTCYNMLKLAFKDENQSTF